jgi:hypothetical protein
VFEAEKVTEKMLHPSAEYEVLSYMFFTDTLINTERDGELLRSKGIVKNLLSSGKELRRWLMA